MELIDKNTLVAEINRRLEAISNSSNEYNRELAVIRGAQQYELINLALFINNLEVKEVDLEKEFDKYTKDISAQDIKYEPFTQLFECAKHFYELGLKAKKGE